MPRTLRTVLGLYVLMFGPGAIFVLCAAKRSRLGGLSFISRAWATNIVLLTVATTAVKATGLTMDPWLCYLIVALLLATGVVWFFSKASRCELALPPCRDLWQIAAAALLCPLIVFAARRPVTATDHCYWPLEAERQLHLLGRMQHGADSAFRVGYSEQWQRLAARRYEIDDWPALIVVHNDAGSPKRYALRLLVASHVEATLHVVHRDRRITSVYLHPRFSRTVHPRNYPPPNLIVACELALPPGENHIQLHLESEDGDSTVPRVVVTDLSGLDAQAARKLFSRHYVVGAIGDVQSNLSLSRNFENHFWLFTHSYGGSRFDGGGPTISNLPFPYYVDHLALLLMGDSPMSLNALHLGVLGCMTVLLVGLAGGWRGPFRARRLALAFASMLCYGVVMRLHVESLYIHTLLTFCFLLCTYHFLQRQRIWFAVYAVFVLLSKGGIVLLGLLLMLALALLTGRRKRTAIDAAIVAVLVLSGLGVYRVAKRVEPALIIWEKEAKSDEYERFNIVQSLDVSWWAKSRPLRAAGGKLTLLVLMASCLLPCQLWFGRDREAWLLLAVGLAFHLIVCASDPCVVSLAAIQHPLNYFVPAGPLLASAGLRAIRLSGRRPRWPEWLVCLLCLAGCIHLVRMHHRPWHLPKHEAMHACALADFLVRRADQLHLPAANGSQALEDTNRAIAICEPHLAETIIPGIYSDAMVVRARALIMQDRSDEGLASVKAALAVSEEHAAVHRLRDRLKKEGHTQTAEEIAALLSAAKQEVP